MTAISFIPHNQLIKNNLVFTYLYREPDIVNTHVDGVKY